MANVCLIRPNDGNIAGQQLAQWGGQLLQNISPPHHLSVDLKGAKLATRKGIHLALQKSNAILYFGHGLPDRLYGQNGSLLDQKNISRAQKKIIIAIACYSSKKLGVAAMQAGARGYLGFEDEIGWYRPISPNVLALIGSSFISGSLRMLNNQATLQQAKHEMENAFDGLINFLKNQARNQLNSGEARRWALWNKVHLQILGNGKL